MAGKQVLPMQMNTTTLRLRRCGGDYDHMSVSHSDIRYTSTNLQDLTRAAILLQVDS